MLSKDEKLKYLDNLEQICEYLETQKYKSDYSPERQVSDFRENPALMSDRRYVGLRLGVVFWNTGYGWSRKKDWKEVLEQKRKEIKDSK